MLGRPVNSHYSVMAYNALGTVMQLEFQWKAANPYLNPAALRMIARTIHGLPWESIARATIA